VQMREEDGQLALAFEGCPSRDGLVEDARQRVDVRAAVDLLALDLLRRDVGDRPDERLLAGQAAGTRGVLGEAEVAQIRRAVAVDQDVRGLDVTMDEATGVRLVERLAYLGHEAHSRLGLKRAVALEQLAQVGPLDVAHRQVHPAVGLAEIEDSDDVGMAQAGGDRRLAQKAPPEAIVVRQLVGKHLQRDPLAPLLLLGQVDGATGALANELDDAVTREDRADGQLPAHGRSLAHVQVSRG
jgi:hypothetical protein